MTAFNKTTDLPPSVDTLEKLAFWSLQALYQMHKGDSYGEIDGEQTPVITFQQGLAAEGTERGIFRVSLKMANNWSSTGFKLWRNCEIFVASNIPESFKTD